MTQPLVCTLYFISWEVQNNRCSTEDVVEGLALSYVWPTQTLCILMTTLTAAFLQLPVNCSDAQNRCRDQQYSHSSCHPDIPVPNKGLLQLLHHANCPPGGGLSDVEGIEWILHLVSERYGLNYFTSFIGLPCSQLFPCMEETWPNYSSSRVGGWVGEAGKQTKWSRGVC